MDQGKPGKKAVAALAAGLALSLVPAAPASAHPVTGDSSSLAQVLVAVAGGLALFAGIASLVMASKIRGKPGRRTSRLATAGLVGIFGGALLFIVGPDLVPTRPEPKCTRPTTTARVEIVSPKEGAVVPAGEVPVEIRLAGGELAGAGSRANRPGEGHLHLALDGRVVSMTGEPKQTVDVPPGDHTLTAEYVANDHAPFCRRVIATRRITVSG